MKPKRKPKPVNIPITIGLVNELGQVMHFALLGMQCGDTSSTNWKSVAKVLLTISIAADDNVRVSDDLKGSMNDAILTLQGISNRELDTGSWQPLDAEIMPIAKGVLAAEAALPLLDYTFLSKALREVDMLMGVI
jgi:hypothetical protein